MRKTIRTLCFALLLLILGEVLLQVRAHYRSGQSVFNAAAGESTYQFNTELGIKTLRPNSVIGGKKSTIETNSFGLRSPQIPQKKDINEIRIAIAGGSTVMGAYTKKNSNTLAYRLEHHLQKMLPHKKITVINGGIAGYTLDEQWLMVKNLLLSFDLDYLVLYSGFNDIKKYCRNFSNEKKNDFSLSKINLPKWLLTVELITKNTVFLRNTPAGSSNFIDAFSVDMSDYENSLENFIKGVKNEGIPMTVLSNARSFRRDMPIDLQLDLSETARYYNECFDVDGLHDIYDRHNILIEEKAKKYGFPFINTINYLPGGDKYFGDATHFSVEGTEIVANFLAKSLYEELVKMR